MRKKSCFFLYFLLLTIFSRAQNWETATEPPDFLTDHSFGFAIEGKGYLVAGTTEFDGPSNEFLQYDPTADLWNSLDSFPGAARGYGIGDVWDRKAYFGFGTSVDSILNDLWVFDPDSMKWTELARCPCEGRLHPALVALNGKIFVGLGNNSNGNLNDWWEYDIATNQWSQKPDFPDSRRHHPYQFAVGDYVYTGFGHGAGIYKDLYRYDPVNESWTRMADIPDEGRVAGTQFSYDNRGYVLSGDGEDHLSMEEGEFWAYDPTQDEWTQLPSHPGKSRWAPASFIIDGVIYLFNGTTYFKSAGYVYQEEAYKFNLEPKVVYPNIERIISHQYYTEIYDIEPMSNGRWALAVKDSPVPLALWEDSLSIIILDSTGNTEKKFSTNQFVGREITEMGPLWVLPNDEIIIRYGPGDCDAGIYEYVLEKFDTAGQSVWHLNFEGWYDPVNLLLAPDGNILFQGESNMLWKLSSSAGEKLWEYGENFESPSSYLFVPGTEDILVGDSTGIKYFNQVIIGDLVTYELLKSQEMDLGSGYLRLLGVDNQNVFYGINTESNEIFRFRTDLQPAFVMMMPDGFSETSFSEDQFALGFGFPELEVGVYDTLGQLIKTYEPGLPGLSVKDISLVANGLAVSGTYQSGPTSGEYPDHLYIRGREEGWFKFISNSTEEDTTQIFSLSVIDVMEVEKPQLDSFYSPGPEPGWLYNINGGRFLVQVANTGTESVHIFSINTIFNQRVNYWFCPPVSAGYTFFENQAIEPGESIWVEFNGLAAEDQRRNPPQFCFWTSGNNNLPDDIPEDDVYCLDRIVSTDFPTNSPYSIYPNPVHTSLNIDAKGESFEMINIYTLTDQLVFQSKMAQLSIDVTNLPSGIYRVAIFNGRSVSSQLVVKR